MQKTKLIPCLVLALLACACSPDESRQMWPPSYSARGVEPNDDAPVKAGAAADRNFAQDKTLTVVYDTEMSYLKFFIPGYSRVDSAILNVQTKDVISPGPVFVYEVFDKNWEETDLTWTNRLQIGSTPLLSFEPGEPQTVYNLDLTAVVREKLDAGDYHIVLCFKSDQPGTNVSFASVEDYDNLKPRFMVYGLTYVPPLPPQVAPEKFTHPGILATREQLAFIREKIQNRESPWIDAFQAATQLSSTQPGYTPTPFEKLTARGFYARGVRTGHTEMNNDAIAAYANAILWALTDSARYAETAIDILDAWAATNKEIVGGNDKLTGGTVAIQFANAAELLKHSNSGWGEDEQRVFENWLRAVMWPLLRDFIPSYNGNWDAIIGQGILSMAIFLDDKFMFDHAVNYYLNGIGNGKMSYYVRENGTTQETLRDQGHEQMGVGALAGFAETAWNQGLDLYSKHDNRLLKGLEGTAKRVIETDTRRWEIWESAYNHYHGRMGLAMPNTEALLTAPGYRPEGYGRYRGFSTLLFYGVK